MIGYLLHEFARTAKRRDHPSRGVLPVAGDRAFAGYHSQSLPSRVESEGSRLGANFSKIVRIGHERRRARTELPDPLRRMNLQSVAAHEFSLFPHIDVHA